MRPVLTISRWRLTYLLRYCDFIYLVIVSVPSRDPPTVDVVAVMRDERGWWINYGGPAKQEEIDVFLHQLEEAFKTLSFI